jgi:hypothetical protein
MSSRLFSLLALVGLTLVAACETLSPEERERRWQMRVQAYEQTMRDRHVGKSVDELVLALGPPASTFRLSDGREVLQYEFARTTTTGGESYTSWQTLTRERRVRDANGVERVVEERETVPVQNVSPIRTSHARCVRRFVADKAGLVESFRWEGNACF